MATLRNQFNLVLGQTIVAKAEARNVIGYSLPSLENTGFAKVRTEPLAPQSKVVRVNESTTDTYITVLYSNITADDQTGGSPIISLNLWYDQGVDNWVSLVGD